MSRQQQQKQEQKTHSNKVVATTRRFPSDSGAFADWSATPSAAVSGRADDLSLGFNASSAAVHGGAASGMWPGASRSFNYNLAPHHDIFVVAPSSFHHHHHNDAVLSDPNNNGSTSVGVNVIPLLTATPCLASPNIILDNEGVMGNNSRNRIQLWQDHESQHQQQPSNYLKKHGHGVIEHNSNSGDGNNLILQSGSVTNSGGSTCQDCGNQAKKDCSHRRCRTCCKSRGFDCPTHLKSTWVPAARRRERQLMTSVAAAGSTGSTSGSKKPRLVASQTTTTSHTSTSNTTPPRSFDTGSSHQDASFKESLPCQVRAPAVFKCVRVTAVDDGEDEYAYQAVVKIGGHVFKGFLYDQGAEDRDGYPNISELHLGGGGGGSSGNVGSGGRNGPMMDPSEVYAASSGGLLGGSSNYGNPIN
ncbi:protein LATERAL ROOT PRIMORDIUM 1-like [Abrus precatorius]|uniref:Protein LATERAL ROOT PRIMORDIUM 1-like n=1 Tax=Abrus precatorius TaxID=3816 RepID=A0A8B8KN31_ABRPR|nr:protein LATERAL ROOT PRIMORDIUM 1-like [Abrus precatorius]